MWESYLFMFSFMFLNILMGFSLGNLRHLYFVGKLIDTTKRELALLKPGDEKFLIKSAHIDGLMDATEIMNKFI